MGIFREVDDFLFDFFVWFEFHWKINFLFSRGQSGLPKEVKFGKILKYWFIDPKSDLNSLRFFGKVKSFIAFILSNQEEIPVFETLNPSHLISFWKNLHFDHLTAELFSSNADKIFNTMFLWSKKFPLDAIKISSK